MAPYIVSARKYRPDTFEALAGQDTIAQTLKNSILRGQLAHAYLFCGPRGVGKTTTARIFAKAINCSNLSENVEPCGQCESCLSFAEGRSYCIHELDAASNNGVEDIKTLMDQVRIPPQVGRYSVYIIDEVHMLSQAAFNAFLKTLEEPPAHAIFILATTEKHKILPTILSRCQTYDFNRITVEVIVRQLREIAEKEDVRIDDESLHVIAVKADGALRDALTIFDQTVAFCGHDVKYEDVLRNLNVLDYEYSFSLVDNFLAGDYASAMLTFDEILTKGFNALHFVAALSSHFRDLVVSKSGTLDALLELPESLKKKYAEQAKRCSLPFLYNALNVTTACESGYRASVNPRLHIEFALLRLCNIGDGASAGVPAAQPAAQAAQQPRSTRPAAQPTAQPTAQPLGQPATQPAAQTSEQPTKQPAAQPATQPAAQPATQPASESAPAPARRTRSSKNSGSNLSLKAMTEPKDAAGPETDSNTVPAESLSEEYIRRKWQELARSYSSRQRLSSAMSGATLELSDSPDGKTLTFKVVNSVQKDWIENKMLYEMEANFRKLTSSGIHLKVGVIETSGSDAPKAYMPSEKAKDLMDKNEEVKNLVKDFELDVK